MRRMTMEAGRLQKFERTKLYDALAAAPAIGLFAWYAVGIAGRAFADLSVFLHDPHPAIALRIANRLLLIAFLGLQIALFLARPVAQGKARGLAPRIAALLVVCLSMSFPAVPPAQQGPASLAISALLGTAGIAACVYILAWLGRSFSIMPEARALVTRGPYRFVRHPLYAAEIVMTIGVMLQFRMPLSALIAFAILAGQIARMGYEERVLEETFPAYAAYRQNTWRLIPYVY